MVISTPFECYYLGAVAGLLKRYRSDVQLELLFPYDLEKKISPEIRRLYNRIHSIWFPKTPFYGDYRDLIRPIQFKKDFNRLNLCPDVICISHFRAHWANILCRHFRKCARLIAFRMGNEESDNIGNIRKPFRQAYYNFYNVIFGAAKMDYCWSDDPLHFPFTMDYVDSPYQAVVMITDSGLGQTGQKHRLLPPFTVLREVYGIKPQAWSDESPVLVVGERTPMIPEWSSDQETLYQQLFDFLREHFRDRKLFFKPRPGYTKLDLLPLDGFEILSGDTLFEEFCIRNHFSRVIAIKSTAVKVAAYFGMPGYALYPIFNFPERYFRPFEAYMQDMRSVVKVKAFNELINCSSNACAIDLDKLQKEYWEVVTGDYL